MPTTTKQKKAAKAVETSAERSVPKASVSLSRSVIFTLPPPRKPIVSVSPCNGDDRGAFSAFVRFVR